MAIELPRNKGRFIKGFRYNPEKEFKKGQISCNKGKKGIYKGNTNPNWKGGPILVICSFCKKIKLVKLYWVKKRQHHFCNRQCYGQWKIYNSRGKNNPNYIDGRFNTAYPPEFNDELKEEIRSRDNFACQNCGITEEEHLVLIGCKLPIHHVDYNKLNCIITNLLTLCNQCNCRANSNRNFWISKFQQLIKEKYAHKRME